MNIKNREKNTPDNPDEVLPYNALVLDSLQRVFTGSDVREARVALQWLRERQKTLSETLDPWDFATVHTLVSSSPFASISFLLDRRTRQNVTNNDGLVHLYVTDEMVDFAARQVEFLDKIGMASEVVRIGSADEDLGSTTCALSEEMQKRLGKGSLIATTSGPPQLRQAMEEEATINNLPGIYTNLTKATIDHIHGAQGIDKVDPLDIDWSGITALDVLRLNPQFRYEQGKPPSSDKARIFEEQVAEDFRKCSNVKLVGTSIAVHNTDANNKDQLVTDLDVVLVLDNGIVTVECKSGGPNTFESEVRHTTERDASRKWGRFSRRVMVVPDGTISEIERTTTNPNRFTSTMSGANNARLDIIELSDIANFAPSLNRAIATNGS